LLCFISSFQRHHHVKRVVAGQSITVIIIITIAPCKSQVPKTSRRYHANPALPEQRRRAAHWGVPYPLPGADSLPFPLLPPPPPPLPGCGESKYCRPPSSRGLGRYPVGGENGLGPDMLAGALNGTPYAPPAPGYIPPRGWLCGCADCGWCCCDGCGCCEKSSPMPGPMRMLRP
jgi:hypothetical protein